MTTVTAEQWSQATTWTGIALSEIPTHANKRYPKKAYKKIPFGSMAGGTDIEFHYARQRIEELFGPQGVGWRIAPHPTLGRVITASEQKTGNKDRKYTEWMVTLECFIFQFAVLLPDNLGVVWNDSSTLSDTHTGEDRGYVERGAMTSLMKQALRGFGGIDHIYDNEGEPLPAASEKAPARAKTEPKPKADAKPTSGATGLPAITAEAKIKDARWDWLEADSRKRLLARFGDVTFGDLPADARAYLANLAAVPPELKAFLAPSAEAPDTAKAADTKPAANAPADKPADKASEQPAQAAPSQKPADTTDSVAGKTTPPPDKAVPPAPAKPAEPPAQKAA